MSEWIKYDGTNKPNEQRLVRIRHDPEVDSDGEAWESTTFSLPNAWLGWENEEGFNKPLISHFMMRGDQ